MQRWIIIIVVIVIICLGGYIVSCVDIETEYVPEIEVEEQELRKTMVTLYFKDGNTNELVSETRMIDSKELLISPYKKILQLLLEGPENENYSQIIPEGTKLLDLNFNKGCVTINFSEEFNSDEEKMVEASKTIFKTLSELTEVITLKIKINGKNWPSETSIIKVNNNKNEIEIIEENNNKI